MWLVSRDKDKGNLSTVDRPHQLALTYLIDTLYSSWPTCNTPSLGLRSLENTAIVLSSSSLRVGSWVKSSVLTKGNILSSDTTFTPNFCPFSTQLQTLSLSLFPSLCFSFYTFITLTNRWQENIRLSTTGHQQLDLLGYQHPKTILFLFPNPILHWNPLSHSCLLPQLKVPDFPNTERE